METDNFSDNLSDKERELIELIGASPLRPVPDNLVERVMYRVSVGEPRPRPFWGATLLAHLQSLQLRPVHGVAMVGLALISFYAGQKWQNDAAPPRESSVAESLYSQEALDDPTIAYAIGRTLLQSEGQENKALAYLQRASLLDPDNPELAYWEGVGYWTVGNEEKERQSYLRGLEADPSSLPLLTNLGHSYLGERLYPEALKAYQAVLSLEPDDPTAIYNSGIAYRKLNMVSEEIDAWHSYLHLDRMGSNAVRAVQRLNSYGDFSFRIYPVGHRRVIMNQRTLLDETISTKKLREELLPVTTILKNNQQLRLEIVVFIEGDRGSARTKASRLRKFIAGEAGADIESRVAISWFDVPETVASPDGKSESVLSESVVLFNRLPDKFSKEIMI